MLHITNGDSAVGAIRQAGPKGQFLPWRDVLHEGPVPAGLCWDELRDVRVRYLQEHYPAEEGRIRTDFEERDRVLEGSSAQNEVVLWFEHDLYDQLQLLQLLDWFHGRESPNRLSLAASGKHLAMMTAEGLIELFQGRYEVTRVQLELGRKGWDAFRSPDPRSIESFRKENLVELPFLKAALYRHLEQFPSRFNGLSRSEAQALQAIRRGRATPALAFTACGREEESEFLGDSIFASYLYGLGDVAHPLVMFADRGPLERGSLDEPSRSNWNRPMALTPLGEDVLDGRRDWLEVEEIDRWLGGVHLRRDGSLWRWDADEGKLRSS